MRFRAPIRFLSAAAALLLLPAVALAQSVHEIIPGGDTVTGGIAADGEVDRVPVRLVEGAAYTVTLKAAKGSALLPDLVLLGLDRRPDAEAAALVVKSAKGNSLSLKKFAVPSTGLRWLEIRGSSGTTGGWILSVKVKLPRGYTTTGLLGVAPPLDLDFPAPGNATAAITVAAPKGSATIPVFDSLLDTTGAVMLVDEVFPTATGFALRNLFLAKPGHYVLRFEPGSVPAGGVTFKAKWKVPKPARRPLLESQVITDPVVTGVDPAGGDTSQVLSAARVTVDFALPGAKVVFRKEPTVVTVAPAAVTVGPSSVSFPLTLSSFQKGLYDVEVENADGGKGTLPRAFSVVNAPPRVTGVLPTSGYDNQVVTLTVTGGFMNSAATLALVRGTDTIPGTSVIGAGSQMQAQFDLRDRAIGTWDFVITNPDSPPTTLAGAFEILNSPPTLTGISPRNNLSSSTPLCTITGADLDATPTASLRRTGQADIAGTDLLWVSGTEMQARFDVTGAATGTWDLVVANPDGRSSTLASAFRVSGPVGSASMVLAPAAAMDAPPSVAHGATRNEFAVAWVDPGSGTWDVYVQRADATGAAQGSKVAVSSSASSVPKKDAVVAWDPVNDQFLVAWAEIRSLSVGSSHPSYPYNSTGVYSVFAQRFRASDLATVGSNVQISSNVTFSGYIMDQFNNFRPSVAWDAKAGLWQIVWLQEWDTSGQYSTDDYDVLIRSLDPAAGTLGTLSGVATSPTHEGDPCIVWDPAGEKYLVAYNARSNTTTPLDIRLGGASFVSDTSADLVDMRMAVDPDSKRLLMTWTRKPSTGSMTTEAVLGDTVTPGNKIGGVVTVGSGTGQDHFMAAPVYNPGLKEAAIAWTRKDGSGGLSVRFRRADTTASGGLALLGSETEASGGSGDEACPAAVLSSVAGETTVFWLKTLTLVSTGAYKGSLLSGTYRGKEVWLQRYQ